MSASNQTTNDPEFGLPVGAILPFASGIAIPQTYLICDGASLLRADYPYLFESIGTIYGAVDAQHFSLPDLTDSYIIGSAVNANVVTPSNITGTITFDPITTDNLPPTPIPLAGDYTFSGTISSSIYRSNPDGTSISNVVGATSFVNRDEGSTFNGGVTTFNSMTISSANANTPITIAIQSNDITLKGYTMPYIIKASPAIVV